MLVRTRVLVTAVALALVPLAVATPAAAHTGGPGGTFLDDNGSPHEGYVEVAFTRGITGGCTVGWRTYCPAGTVNRGQMASFLARALGLPAPSRDHFPDDAGNPHEDNINRVADAQITSGDGAGLYRPELPVSRAQMASFLVRGFELEPSSQDRFSDDAGSPHEANINAVAQAGITTGCGGTSYCPNQSVTRGQMATFLGRSLGVPPVDVPPILTFGAGQYRVGPDIAAGTYRNSSSDDGCYWERLSGFSGEFDDVIANDFTDARTLVTIDGSDAGFESTRCGTWTNDLWPITESPTASFGAGTYQVGEEVAPGTWQTPGTPDGGCYWERLSGFSGEFEDVIANEFADEGTVTVTIAESDLGFSSSGCGTWQKIG